MKTYSRQPETKSDTAQPKASQQASAHDILQTYKDKIAQRQEIDEDELLQGKFEIAQRKEIDEDELLQGKFETAQPSTENLTGMPDNLKSGIESLSGYSMDDVRVHYNSSKPAQLQALAYAQGTDIHIAPGQEQHLPHEAWHVVQQKQGRVQPTTQLQGVNVNDNEGLEKEADVMGQKAVQEYPHKKPTQETNVINKSIQLKDKDLAVTLSLNKRQYNNENSVIQAFGLANVVLDRDSESNEIYIMNINFKERVPTDTKGTGQGDHTVAETLIEESMRALCNLNVEKFLSSLLFLMQNNLTGEETARHTDEYDATYFINCINLYNEIDNFKSEWKSTDPIYLQYFLSDFLSQYWRLLNKREMTACIRSEGFTTGGGEGFGEMQAKAQLLDLRDRLNEERRWWAIHEYVIPVAQCAIGFIDLNISVVPENIQHVIFRRAAQHCATVMGIKNTDWINKVAAHIFNILHEKTDKKRMAPKKAPESWI